MVPVRMSPKTLLIALAVFAAVSLSPAFAQDTGADAAVTSAATAAPAASGVAPVIAVEPVDKRILGVLPNYRTVQDTGHVAPIPAKRKLWIASKDSFDYPIWLLAAGFAGMYQLQNEEPSFGQGVKGYFKRYGTSFVDQSMGNMLTEGVFPSLLHEDPRYFRQGTGGAWHRAGYALTRIFVTRTDAGTKRFNFSEFIGNSIVVGVSNSYYPDDRTVGDNLQKLGLQLGTDALSNLMKEFWPDVKRRFLQRHHDQVTSD